MQIAGIGGFSRLGLSLAALSLLLLGLVAAGCGNDGGGGDSAGPPAALADGGVLRARAPIVGATVTAYKAGTSGYGLGAVVLATTKSDSHGNFSFAAASCNTGDLIYYVATGGDAGAGVNPAIVLMSEVGTCGALPGFVVINEVHTVAAAYALAQFMGKSSPYRVGAPESNAIGISNAFATVGNLVQVNSNGGALAVTPGGGTAPQRNLNTLANALAGCVNSSGPDSAACAELFVCARPGAIFEATCSRGSGATPADTLEAALNVALNPASVSMAGLFQAAAAYPVFSPTLTSAPNDWGMLLIYVQPAAKFASPWDVAIDGSGRVWVANTQGASVTALNNDGSLYGNFHPTDANFNHPLALAVDNTDHIWVTDFGSNSVTALNNDGSLRGNFNPPDANFSGPTGVAIYSKGHVWVANWAAGSITALNNDGSLQGNFAPPGANFVDPDAVAIDGGGHLWVPSFNSVTALNNDGTLYGNFAPPGANFSGPAGLAIDGAGHVWVANEYYSSLTELNSDGTLRGFFRLYGLASESKGVAIDSAGNVWATTGYLYVYSKIAGVSELVGAASPVRTPLAPGGPIKP